jgi:D-beta-D-heptose 7-phosphate kinase/D-beta-D-heptose 1-phosphate adenosyltransferase
VSRRLVVVGDALLDRDLDGRAERLAPDAPVPVVDGVTERARPGGAGLAAAIAAASGADVVLVCALGDDAAGRRLVGLLADAGVDVLDVGLRGPTPEKVRVRAQGRPLVRLDAGGSGSPCGELTAAAQDAIGHADGVLVSDYGRGLAARASVRAAIAALAADVPVVWDPHPRGPEPVPGVLLATPNAAEAERFVGRGEAEAQRLAGSGETDEAQRFVGSGEAEAQRFVASGEAEAQRFVGSGEAEAQRLAGSGEAEAQRFVGSAGAGAGGPEAAARALAARWRAVNVCVTLGARGALMVGGHGPALAVPAPGISRGDPCGAGDCFAATAAARLARGALPSEAVHAAVQAASAFVAAGGAAAWPPERADAPAPDEARELAARTRAAGGVVVATGGCFDLLHAGHVRALEAARALGDRLIVCLNSDDSVRRIKGPDRPLVGQDDRAAVLRALACVDAVAIFEEDDPRAVLRELRPHLWAKGGDYAVAELPEAQTLAEWGGRAVIVPYVAGRSTTRLIEEARVRVT